MYVYDQPCEFYELGCARGIWWNDPALSMVWPGEIKMISQHDANYPTDR